MTSHKDPFIDICIHGIKGARTNREGIRVSPGCLNCFPDRRSKRLDVFTMTSETSRDEDRKES